MSDKSAQNPDLRSTSSEHPDLLLATAKRKRTLSKAAAGASGNVFITTTSSIGPDKTGSDAEKAAERRAIRAQAARSSAAARTATLAKKRALKRQQENARRAVGSQLPPTPGSTGDYGSAGADQEILGGSRGEEEIEEVRREIHSTARLIPNIKIRNDMYGSTTIVPQPRSLLSAARSDPFRCLPTAHWNNSTAYFIDHFLTNFAPPPNSRSDMHGREIMRLDLWPLIMSNSQLFETMLLVAGTNMMFSDRTGMRIGILNLRHNALQSINYAISTSENGCLGPCALGAIALLAGWELMFGNPDAFDTHMLALKGIVARLNNRAASVDARAGSAAPILPPIIEEILMSMGHDFAAFANKPVYFPRPCHRALYQQYHSPSQLPIGFRAAINKLIITPDLLYRVSELKLFDAMSPNAELRLGEIAHRIEQYDHYATFGSGFSFLQSEREDEINAQSIFHVRAAGLALCGALRTQLGTSTLLHDIDLYMDACTGTSLLSQHVAALQPDLLLGTVFEEILLWALAAICTATNVVSETHTKVFVRLMRNLQLCSFEQLRDKLNEYIFPMELLEQKVEALYEISIAQGSVNQMATPPSSDGEDISLTRYDRSNRHPTILTGAMILQDEDDVVE